MITEEKIEQFLEEDGELFEEADIDILDMTLDLIMSLSEDQITESQADKIAQILETIDPEESDDEELSEVFKKRQRRDLQAARKRRREYKRKRAKVKLKARRYRRSASGKKTIRRAKRYSKFGRTSTMKRQRKFIGPKLSRR